MLASVGAFVEYFDGVNRRAIRDVGMLPAEAENWTPPGGEGEKAWTIGQIVGHMAASRLYFIGAYCGQGWIGPSWTGATDTREQWATVLQSSADQVREQLAGTPDSWLSRKIDPQDRNGFAVSGWRLLMMMTEHDVHHRSQIDTYAGVMGWPVAHIFGRAAEDVGLQPRRTER